MYLQAILQIGVVIYAACWWSSKLFIQ